MTIEKIKKLSNGKYKIVFDNSESITTYEDIILEENILYKKELDVDSILDNLDNLDDGKN